MYSGRGREVCRGRSRTAATATNTTTSVRKRAQTHHILSQQVEFVALESGDLLTEALELARDGHLDCGRRLRTHLLLRVAVHAEAARDGLVRRLGARHALQASVTVPVVHAASVQVYAVQRRVVALGQIQSASKIQQTNFKKYS